MTTDDFIQLIFSISLLSVFKLLILLSLALYFIFSLIVVRQVRIMTSTFQTGLEEVLQLISWLHLALVIIIFIVILFAV